MNAAFTMLRGGLEPRSGGAMQALMAGQTKIPRSGGALLAAAIVAGALGGAIGGEPSVGIVAGIAVGLALLAAVWIADRRA